MLDAMHGNLGVHSRVDEIVGLAEQLGHFTLCKHLARSVQTLRSMLGIQGGMSSEVEDGTRYPSNRQSNPILP